MNHRELYSTMSDAEADQAFLCELQEKLNQELMKPIEERDFDKIEKWTEAICMINGTEQQIQQRAARNIMALQNRNRKHIVHSQRKTIAAPAGISLRLCSNRPCGKYLVGCRI